jgi:hypothetical protein
VGFVREWTDPGGVEADREREALAQRRLRALREAAGMLSRRRHESVSVRVRDAKRDEAVRATVLEEEPRRAPELCRFPRNSARSLRRMVT